MISSIVCIWIAAGLFFSALHIHLLCAGNPRLMDFLIGEVLKEIKESETKLELSRQSIEFYIKLWLTFAYLLAWPLLVVKK